MDFEPLAKLYGNVANVVRRAGRVHPAAIEPHGAAAAGLVEPSPDPAWIDPALRAAGRRHLELVQSRSPRMHNGRVMACVTSAGFPLTCAPAGYFDAIATSDSLRAELLDAMGDGPPAQLLDVLPLRRLAHAACDEDPLHSGRGRVAAVGVSVAVTLPTVPVRALVLGLRNHEVATDPDMWHVAPSGTLEPSKQDPVLTLIEHELYEELGIRVVRPAELPGRLSVLGVGFDLLRLRPEICLRLDLLPEELPQAGVSLSPREFQDNRLIEISQSSLSAFWEAHPPELLTPAAASTVALLESTLAGARP